MGRFFRQPNLLPRLFWMTRKCARETGAGSFLSAAAILTLSMLSRFDDGLELDLFPERWWEETTGVRRSIVRCVAFVSSINSRRKPSDPSAGPMLIGPRTLEGAIDSNFALYTGAAAN
jgi:hypothetical protein